MTNFLSYDQQVWLVHYWMRTNIPDTVNPLMDNEDWDGLRAEVREQLIQEFGVEEPDDKDVEEITQLFIDATEH